MECQPPKLTHEAKMCKNYQRCETWGKYLIRTANTEFQELFQGYQQPTEWISSAAYSYASPASQTIPHTRSIQVSSPKFIPENRLGTVYQAVLEKKFIDGSTHT